MTDKTLLTVADLWHGLLDLERDTGVVVNINDKLADIKDVHYDKQTDTVIIEPNYDTMPEVNVKVANVEALEEALTKIASYTHFNDDCPEWYKKETLDNMHEDEPEYVEMLAWDESHWYDRWREDHGHEDNEYLEHAVEIARDALHNNRGDLNIYDEVIDGFQYDINNSLTGKARWIGHYFICWHTDGVANDNYLMFEEVDDAKAYLQWIADTDALFDAQIKHGQRFPLPEAPKAINTGDSMDPFVEFILLDKFHKIYDKRNKDMTLSELGFFPE